MTTTDDGNSDLDTAVAERFAARMIDVLNDGCIALMTSIGHQTGLFDTLAGLNAPATSQEIADRAELNERYVREWLGAMTTARVTRHDDQALTYWLPREHAISLTESAGPDNLARFMQYVAHLAEVEQPIIECFRRGGGLSYGDYPRFHSLMAEDSGAVFEASLVDTILPVVPGAVQRLHDGIAVADIGCGSGHAINVMAQAFPESRFTGYDFSEEAIDRARVESQALGLLNTRFEVQDVADLDVAESYDLITAFDAIHDQARPSDVLRRIADALRPDGTFLMVDTKASSNVNENVDTMFGPFLYTISTMHCMSVSLGLGGAGLGAAWGHQLAVTMLHDAGFTKVDLEDIAEDPFNHYYLARTG